MKTLKQKSETLENQRKTMFTKKIIKIGFFATLIIAMSAMLAPIALAAPATADEMWNNIIGVVTTWIPRLAAVVMLIGGIALGLGFKNDDPNQKTGGITTMVAAGIVGGIALVVNQLLI